MTRRAPGCTSVQAAPRPLSPAPALGTSHRPGAKMKSRACRSAAATCGCHRSTMNTTRGPSSAAPGGREERFEQPGARTHAELEPHGSPSSTARKISDQECDRGFPRLWAECIKGNGQRGTRGRSSGYLRPRSCSMCSCHSRHMSLHICQSPQNVPHRANPHVNHRLQLTTGQR